MLFIDVTARTKTDALLPIRLNIAAIGGVFPRVDNQGTLLRGCEVHTLLAIAGPQGVSHAVYVLKEDRAEVNGMIDALRDQFRDITTSIGLAKGVEHKKSSLEENR